MAFKLDSDLSAVNSILGAIGQAPVTTLNGPESPTAGAVAGFMNPEVALCYNLLMETNTDVQTESWYFNTENAIPFAILGGTGADKNRIKVPDSALNMNVSGGNVWRTVKVTEQQGYLYNKTDHTFDWNNWHGGVVYCDVVWLRDFEDVPPTFQRYITLRASERAATQLVSNPQLAQLLMKQADFQRAACIQENADMGDNTYFGWPMDTAYRSYQPYETLARGQYGMGLGPFNNRSPRIL